MSLITCCPTCRTMFKVVPDQLKVSDGWVRCGHCDGVFDASAHFQAIPEPEASHSPAPEFVAEAAVSAPVFFSVVNDSDVQIDPVQPAMLPASPEVSAAARFVSQSHADDASVSAPLSSYLSAPEAPDFSVQEDHTRSQDGTDRRALYGSTTSNKPVSSVKTEDGRRQSLSEVSFVQSAKRRDKPTSLIFRGLSLLLFITLVFTLLLQVLLHDRDAFAARYLALRPVLQTLCQKIGCQINPPRVIEAIAIDSSSFTQTGPDAYRLNVVLKNTRPSAVAMPALEVTLTGLQNEVVLRKVLRPTEFGSTSDRLESAVPFVGVLTLLVSPTRVPAQPLQASSAATPAEPTPVAEETAASVQVTGYRIFAFYP